MMMYHLPVKMIGYEFGPQTYRFNNEMLTLGNI